MQLYQRDPKNENSSDSQKIDLTLSFIRGPKADPWVENYVDTRFDKANGAWQDTYVQFITKLKAWFVDSNLERQAQIRIEHYKQEKNSAEIYFQNFGVLMNQAGYAETDSHIIQLIELNVNENLIDKVYNCKTLPTTYQEWKTAII
ncbi:hypothetical protein L218DRAFT_887101 [Marasmius fiardii PR-910]|nr:hypothetical protein L218DRAFT_887101 [Marasmius fiardii PR-910]